ncbi:MAG: hypothetical protein RLW62_19300 [Gammaproteobacteria bacterium]
MKMRSHPAALALTLVLATPCALAREYGMTAPNTPQPVVQERMIVGTETGDRLVQEGMVDTLSAPGRIVDEIGEDARNFGAGAIITGTARGAVLATGQALKGGASMLVGILDILTGPLKD